MCSLLLSKDSDFLTRQLSVVGGTFHSDSDQNKETEEILMSGIQHVVEATDLQPLPSEEVEDNNPAGSKWSDRQLAAAGKRLTGISIWKTRDGVFISSIRAR